MPTDLLVALGCAFLFGTLAGSFLNVCAWRLPRNLSVVHPPSRCGACGTRLAWHENLPVIGYLRLGGRCAQCGTALSPRYLLMELLTGALCAGTVAWAWSAPHAPAPWIADPTIARAFAGAVVLTAVFLALVATVVDLDHQIIPDEISLPMMLLLPVAAVLVAVPAEPALTDTATGTLARLGGIPAGWLGLDGTAPPSVSRFAAGGAATIGAALAAIALTIPVAGRLYRGLPAGERWSDDDLRAFRLGTGLALVGIAVAAGAALAAAGGGAWLPAIIWHQAALGAAIGWLLPVLVGLIGSALLRRGAMGFGDAKLFMPLGALLGPQGTVEAFVIAVFIGAALGIPGWLRGGSGVLPFGPSLVAGWAVVLAAGPWLPRPW
jgi:leader peptidase (prepilin peptidase)/N-methyltransferase